MLPHRPRVADRSAGVVFSPLRAVGRDTLPTGVGGCYGIAPHSKTEETK